MPREEFAQAEESARVNGEGGNHPMSIIVPTVRRTDSLYAKLGGRSSLDAIVEEFYGRVMEDPALAPCFARTNPAALRNRQVQFLTQALGGPRSTAASRWGQCTSICPLKTVLMRELRSIWPQPCVPSGFPRIWLRRSWPWLRLSEQKSSTVIRTRRPSRQKEKQLWQQRL